MRSECLFFSLVIDAYLDGACVTLPKSHQVSETHFFFLEFRRMLLNLTLEEMFCYPQLNVYNHQGMFFSIKGRTLFLLDQHILDSLSYIIYYNQNYSTIYLRVIKNIQKMIRDPFLIHICRNFKTFQTTGFPFQLHVTCSLWKATKNCKS